MRYCDNLVGITFQRVVEELKSISSSKAHGLVITISSNQIISIYKFIDHFF